MSFPVVSGMGVIACCGSGPERFWNGLIGGVQALSKAADLPASPTPVPEGPLLIGMVPDDWILCDLPTVNSALCDRYTMLAIVAAQQAMRDAQLDMGSLNPSRVGVIIGNGGGGFGTLERGFVDIIERKRARISPASVAKFMPSAAASWISMAFGITGPVFAISSACASAAHAIMMSAQLIDAGIVDVVVTGGVESCLTGGALRAWASLGVLSPEVCRPFDRGRRGIVLSEGAGILILESASHARARGISASVGLAGWGCSADAGDLTAPDAKGMGAAMRAALASAGLAPSDIDYVNAHGTGTRANDNSEVEAIHAVFSRSPPPVSSTKSVHGHALGGAGGLEAVATIQAIVENLAPPTINFSDVDPACAIDCVANVARPLTIDAAMSNSFAFGGLNASLIFRRM
jgi:nodulation protein E